MSQQANWRIYRGGGNGRSDWYLALGDRVIARGLTKEMAQLLRSAAEMHALLEQTAKLDEHEPIPPALLAAIDELLITLSPTYAPPQT